MQELRKSVLRLNTMAKQSLNKTQKRMKPESKYFKILQNDKLPQLPIQPSKNRKVLSPEKLIEDYVKQKKYVYVDLYQQNGFSPMEREDKNQTIAHIHEDQQLRVGNNRIFNLRYLSEQTRTTNDYLQRAKQFTEQKNSMRTLFKVQLENSLKKLNRRKNYRYDYQSLKPKKHEYNPDKLRKFLEDQELDKINLDIWKREQRLMNKFGIGQDYLPNNSEVPRISESVKLRKYRGQGKLPELSLSTIQ